MERTELIKSIMIMAGIPLAFSVACSLIARINKDRKNTSFQDGIQETEFGFTCNDDIDDADDVNDLREQILALRSKIEELQEVEGEIEVGFLRFIDLKDQEYALMEVKNSLCMEKERAEFFVSSMEAEKKKFDEMMIEYLKALGEVESWRMENGFLRRREKKLLKKTRESLRLIRKQNSTIEAGEAEMLRHEAELERKEKVMAGLECEVEEMRAAISRLQNEKEEVLKKLETAQKQVVSKDEAEGILVEKYNRVVNELEKLQNDRASELKEVIYLRWCHACLRHELARRNELEQERKSAEEIRNTDDRRPQECIEHESDDDQSVVHKDEPFYESGQRHTKRRWLVRKFKKWVEGSHDEKHHETVKCFGSQSVVDEAEERHVAGRKSFSSV